jgi:sugar lactone lactonase YvrE
MRTTATALADGFSLLEGPRWAHDALYVSDFFTHRVLRFPSPSDGRYTTVCEVSGQPSGLAVDGAGTVFVVSMLDVALLRWDGSELVTVADLSGHVTGPGNDMTMDRAGRAYVGNFGLRGGTGTDLEPTALLCVDPDGSTTVVADDLIFPNGIVLSGDERTLFVAETYRGRVTAFDVLEEGSLGGRRTWAAFGPSPVALEIKEATEQLPWLPDGLALDAEGALWVADAKGAGISRMVEGGQVVDYVDTSPLSVYAAALGGPDLTTLFLCCAPPVETFDPKAERRSVLMSCEVNVPGIAGPTP